jgi:hypothetical protein
MAQTYESEPAREGSRAAVVWTWLLLLALAFWPRLFILGFWLFGSQLGRAFDTWIVPVAGFFLAPSTIFAYAVMWSVNSDDVTGLEWLVVALGVALDLWMWALSRRLR